MRSDFVAQIWVYGNSFKDHLVAIVVPQADVLIPWAKQNLPNAVRQKNSLFPRPRNAEPPLQKPTMADLCSNPRVKQVILDDLTKIGKQAELRGFEFMKNVHLEPNEWQAASDFMTPTMKLRRANMQTHYAKVIDELYAAAPAAPTAKL